MYRKTSHEMSGYFGNEMPDHLGKENNRAIVSSTIRITSE